MTTNIHKNSIFTCKEHYLAFRAAWAKRASGDTFQLMGAHHVLYNILRGRSYDKGFSPITKHSKLHNGFYINQGLYQAVRDLCRPHEWLDVFDGTVTKEMIENILIPECKPMYSNYGPYKKVAHYILSCDVKNIPKNFDDVEAIRETLAKEHR